VSYGLRRVRRGRSRRSRRRMATACFVILLVVAGFAALRIVSAHFSSSDAAAVSESSQRTFNASLAGLAAQSAIGVPNTRNSRLVYPYSVVPGGVQSPDDLEQAAAHDPLVAQHYSGFDYQHAKVIEVQQPELVYLSYRLRNRIYWTSKRIRLHRGEKLISDGKMTARSRCGNRVSESAQKAVSPEEPPAEKFDQPYLADGGTATQAPFPGTFESTLRNPPEFGGAGPAGPPLTNSYLFGPGGGTGYPSIFPPPLPINGGACNTIFSHPGPVEKGAGQLDDTAVERNCPKKPGPGGGPTPPPPVVPEPSTILLFTSGAAGVYLRYRKAASKD
jgi:hypothetical protein